MCAVERGHLLMAAIIIVEFQTTGKAQKHQKMAQDVVRAKIKFSYLLPTKLSYKKIAFANPYSLQQRVHC